MICMGKILHNRSNFVPCPIILKKGRVKWVQIHPRKQNLLWVASIFFMIHEIKLSTHMSHILDCFKLITKSQPKCKRFPHLPIAQLSLSNWQEVSTMKSDSRLNSTPKVMYKDTIKISLYNSTNRFKQD